MCCQTTTRFKCLGTPIALIGSVVTITVNQTQVRFKRRLLRGNFGTNVTFKEFDVTNAVNSFHMRFNTGFIQKDLTSDLTHVRGVFWSWRLYSKMDAIHVIVEVMTSLEALWAKLALERLVVTQAVNSPTMATLAARIRKSLAACLTLMLRRMLSASSRFP